MCDVGLLYGGPEMCDKEWQREVAVKIGPE